MQGRLIAMALLALPTPLAAADLTVYGCNERGAGEIGIRELVGDVGDTVAVAVTIHTTTTVDAFSLNVAFPDSLLTYLGPPFPGSLTPPPPAWTLAANYSAVRSDVLFGGFSTVSPLPPGTIGSLGYLRFVVTGAGVDSFSTGNYVDDIAGYTPCESVHAPTPVDAATWGRVKALYR